MKRCNPVGGQALIEGVLMRNGERIAMVFRQPDGNLVTDSKRVKPMGGLWKLPLLRGIGALVTSMKIGVSALNKSAAYFEGESEKSAFEKWLEKQFGERAEQISLGLTMLTSLGMAVLFFIFLPAFLVSFLKPYLQSGILLSLIEGLVKMGLFLLYIALIRQLKEIRRVFEYHGAEHKAVFNYESGLELSVENARNFSRLHPRCGTSYIFFVLALSIALFSFVSWTHVWVRVLLKLLFLPVVAGLGYELLQFSAGEGSWIKLLRVPGLWLQRLTTAEPDDGQLEVALLALKEVVEDETA